MKIKKKTCPDKYNTSGNLIQISCLVIIRLNSEDADEKGCEYLLPLFIVKSSCYTYCYKIIKTIFFFMKKKKINLV